MGCLFHFKQALHKYLIQKCGLGLSKVLKEAMALGGLDILCILPRNEVEKFGIPYLHYILELGLQPWEIEKLDIIFWPYFKRHWIPIMQSWNLIGKDGAPLQIVNRTNNALESYNRRFNEIFSKQPTLIEFAMLIEEESRHQAQFRQDIITGRKRETERMKIWIPDVPESYLQLKAEYHYLGDASPTAEKAPKAAANAPTAATSKFGCAGHKKAAEDDNDTKKAATSKGGCKKVEEGEQAAPLKKQGRKAAATEHQDIAEPVVAEKRVKRSRKAVNYLE